MLAESLAIQKFRSRSGKADADHTLAGPAHACDGAALCSVAMHHVRRNGAQPFPDLQNRADVGRTRFARDRHARKAQSKLRRKRRPDRRTWNKLPNN